MGKEILRRHMQTYEEDLHSCQQNDILRRRVQPFVDTLNRETNLLVMAGSLLRYLKPIEMLMEDDNNTYKSEIQNMFDTDPDFCVVTGITKYYNDKGELLYVTNDGMSVIIIVPDDNVRTLENKLNEAYANGTINKPETNKREMHPLGKTLQEYSNEKTKGMGDYWVLGYKETYEKAYKEGMSQFSLGQLASSIIAAIAQQNNDPSGEVRHSGRAAGIMDGNYDRKNGKINRLNPQSSLKNNKPLIILKKNLYHNEK